MKLQRKITTPDKYQTAIQNKENRRMFDIIGGGFYLLDDVFHYAVKGKLACSKNTSRPKFYLCIHKRAMQNLLLDVPFSSALGSTSAVRRYLHSFDWRQELVQEQRY